MNYIIVCYIIDDSKAEFNKLAAYSCDYKCTIVFIIL